MLYKNFTLIEVSDGIAWSDHGGWLDCIFDNHETAKFFIDIKNRFVDNIYDVISQAQKIANKTNNGYVSIDIIKCFKLK